MWGSGNWRRSSVRGASSTMADARTAQAPLRTKLEPGERPVGAPIRQELEESDRPFSVGAPEEPPGGRLTLVVVVAGRALLLKGAEVARRLGQYREPLALALRGRLYGGHVVVERM